MWLIRGIQGTAFAGSQLAHLIATSAELHEFLEAAPQARRLLNPLCRALGIDFDRPTGVVLPKPVREPAPRSTSEPLPEAPIAKSPIAASPPMPSAQDIAAPATDPPPSPPGVFSSV
jgi:hypothetical protein